MASCLFLEINEFNKFFFLLRKLIFIIIFLGRRNSKRTNNFKVKVPISVIDNGYLLRLGGMMNVFDVFVTHSDLELW